MRNYYHTHIHTKNTPHVQITYATSQGNTNANEKACVHTRTQTDHQRWYTASHGPIKQHGALQPRIGRLEGNAKAYTNIRTHMQRHTASLERAWPNSMERTDTQLAASASWNGVLSFLSRASHCAPLRKWWGVSNQSVHWRSIWMTSLLRTCMSETKICIAQKRDNLVSHE